MIFNIFGRKYLAAARYLLNEKSKTAQFVLLTLLLIKLRIQIILPIHSIVRVVVACIVIIASSLDITWKDQKKPESFGNRDKSNDGH